MSLRHYEWRLCDRGHITSKPSIHNDPFYEIARATPKRKENQRMRFWYMKNRWLQDEGVDCSSHCMRVFVWDLKVPKGFPKFPMEFPIVVVIQDS